MEVVGLKVFDVDSKRMMIRVEQGKGRKDRFAMLSPQLLELLRDWWRTTAPAPAQSSRWAVIRNPSQLLPAARHRRT
jgi:integrase